MNRRFGRLFVIERALNDASGAAAWLCQCDCGKEKIILGPSLRRGASKSCGCLRRDVLRALRTKHGDCGSTTYLSWCKIKSRCLNPNDSDFPNYGGRGIVVCNQWRDSYETFLADMGPRPDGKSIDRRDNDGDYEPSNCRWANAIEQANNKRNVRRIEFQGCTHTIPQWARELGLKPSTIHRRFDLGWSVKRTLTTPLDTRYSSHHR